MPLTEAFQSFGVHSLALPLVDENRQLLVARLTCPRDHVRQQRYPLLLIDEVAAALFAKRFESVQPPEQAVQLRGDILKFTTRLLGAVNNYHTLEGHEERTELVSELLGVSGQPVMLGDALAMT